MNENMPNETEIDLKYVFYNMLLHWRRSGVFGIVLALLLVAYSLLGTLSVLNDPEKFEKAQNDYNVEYNAYYSELNLLQADYEQVIQLKNNQAKYNEESLLMQINPAKCNVGIVSILADSPLSSEGHDLNDVLFSAYQSFFTSGELQNSIIEKTGITDNVLYLRDLITIDANSITNVIKVKVRANNDIVLSDILSVIRTSIIDEENELKETIGDHSLVVSYSKQVYYDYELESAQLANRSKLDTYNSSLVNINTNLIDLKQKGEPEFDYSTFSIIKSVIKMGLIGFVAGVFLVMVWYALKYIFSARFKSEKLSGIVCNSHIIASIPVCKHKADKWLVKLFGFDNTNFTFDEACELASSNIQKIIENLGDNKVACIGHIDADTANNIVAKLQKPNIEIKNVGDILVDAKAVDELANFKYLVVFAQEDCNTNDQIAREFEQIRVFGKECIGTIVVK